MGLHGVFVEPKTQAGIRTVPLAPWLVAELRAHIQREVLEGDALLFATSKGTPYNPSNVIRDIWSPLVTRMSDVNYFGRAATTIVAASGDDI
jgi:hypothetical protein